MWHSASALLLSKEGVNEGVKSAAGHDDLTKPPSPAGSVADSYGRKKPDLIAADTSAAAAE
jgi:hypothetical protein